MTPYIFVKKPIKLDFFLSSKMIIVSGLALSAVDNKKYTDLHQFQMPPTKEEVSIMILLFGLLICSKDRKE